MKDAINHLLANTGFVALMGTLFGGAGLEIVRRLLDRKQRGDDEASKIRGELRTEIEGLRSQLGEHEKEEQRLQAELDRWKGLYYEQKEDYLRVFTELQIFKERLRVIEERLNPKTEDVTIGGTDAKLEQK